MKSLLIALSLSLPALAADASHGSRAVSEGRRVCLAETKALLAAQSEQVVLAISEGWHSLAACLQSKTQQSKELAPAVDRVVKDFVTSASIDLTTGKTTEAKSALTLGQAVRADAWAWLLVSRDAKVAVTPETTSAKEAWASLAPRKLGRELDGAAKALCKNAACANDPSAALFTWLGQPPDDTVVQLPETPKRADAGRCNTAFYEEQLTLSEGAKTPDCACDAGVCSASRPPRKPTTSLTGAACRRASVFVPHGMSVVNDCNTERCTDGVWVSTTLACPRRQSRVVTLERIGVGPVRAELLVFDVPRVARPNAGKDFAPETAALWVRLINISTRAVKLDVGGDTFSWKFTPAGPVASMTRSPDCTQMLMGGVPVELSPGAFIEVSVPFLADNDRCKPTQYTWTAAGAHTLAFELSVGLGGVPTPLGFRTRTPLPITVK